MLPYPKKALQRLILVLGMFAVGLVVAYHVGGLLIQDSPGSPHAAEVVKDNKIKITANTDIVQKIVYLKCGDEEVYRFKPADNLIGLNMNQVQQIYTSWSIDKFDTQEVEMSMKVDSYCREHANNLFLGVKDGFIAVFYGKPGPKAIVKEVTKIPIKHLSPEDLAEISQGLVVQSREELLRTLEGLQSR